MIVIPKDARGAGAPTSRVAAVMDGSHYVTRSPTRNSVWRKHSASVANEDFCVAHYQTRANTVIGVNVPIERWVCVFTALPAGLGFVTPAVRISPPAGRKIMLLGVRIL